MAISPSQRQEFESLRISLIDRTFNGYAKRVVDLISTPSNQIDTRAVHNTIQGTRKDFQILYAIKQVIEEKEALDRAHEIKSVKLPVSA